MPLTVEDALKLPVDSIIRVESEHILVIRVEDEEVDLDDIREALDNVLPSGVAALVTRCELDVDSLERDEAKELLKELRDVVEEDEE